MRGATFSFFWMAAVRGEKERRGEGGMEGVKRRGGEVMDNYKTFPLKPTGV